MHDDEMRSLSRSLAASYFGGEDGADRMLAWSEAELTQERTFEDERFFDYELDGQLIRVSVAVVQHCWCGLEVNDRVRGYDLDPGDPENGPRPEIVGFCSEDHREQFLREQARDERGE